LLKANADVVDRARTQVGNLAHALKTPLSVITNEADVQGDEFARKVSEQAGIMRDQVDLYLDRARRAARAHALGAVTDVSDTLRGIVRTLERINVDKPIEARVHCPADLRFMGERQDFEEMVGNLLDNAFKWASSRVLISARHAAQARQSGRTVMLLTVEDDGPGLPADRREYVLKRGRRLDETKPGSGLGLSIVAEIAAMYDGHLSLSDSSEGGLKITLTLPAARGRGFQGTT
jgi:signal transduction histidine kinase